MAQGNKKKIILYTSSQLKKTPQTGGTKRFQELIRFAGNHCHLVLASGDEYYNVPEKTSHFSMHQTEVYPKEYYYAKHNRSYLKMLRNMDYDWLIAFDVPPAFWLSVFRMPHLCLMVRKDLIGYNRIILDGRKCGMLKKTAILKANSLAELITLLHAERIIVQCEYDKKQLIQRHKLFKQSISKKTFVRINNVNPSWATKSTRIKASDTDTIRIGSVNGFNDLRKGPDIFLEAVSSLIDDGIPVEAFIAGDGLLLQEYKEKYISYKSIHFDGRTDAPVDYIKELDLAVVPSRADSCPNTVMEAIYNDVPVIASNVGGIPEIICNNSALFEPSSAGLKAKIMEYIEDSALRSSIIENQKIRKKELTFDWSRSIIETLTGD